METDASVIIDRIVLCPLTKWPPNVEMSLPFGISVKVLDEHIKEELSHWADALSGREIESLKKTKFWITYCFDGKPMRTLQAEERAMEIVNNAAVALQIVAPVGGHWIMLVGRNDSKGRFLSDAISRPPEIISTQWARTFGFPGVHEADFQKTVEQVQYSFDRKIVPLQNAVQLLEHSMQSTNLHLRLLFRAIALDVLLMAGSTKIFCARLSIGVGSPASFAT